MKVERLGFKLSKKDQQPGGDEESASCFGDRSKSCPDSSPATRGLETHQAALSQPSMNSLLLDGDEPLDEQFLQKKLMVIGC